ncbi:GguC family protein [Massilia terrae]|uniref:GguC family protein n=1 Tax=Massilia terrae TaxID=1811224 RepID=A0ABT2CUZ0_9BURK|nr:AraD1 family protein [Massilia terrae]MCS0657798.1 GguC family protein [Massilia terrae]
MLLVQFTTTSGQRRVGALDGDTLRIIEGYSSTLQLARAAIAKRVKLAELAGASIGDATAAFGAAASEGRILPPLDHPDPAHCYVTGTGLTHLGSADTRDAMHKKIGGDVAALSDSMKMFRMGVEGGKPQAGEAGVQPEWFYKGDGSIVRASGQALDMPDFALDGGEEPEIAGLYLIGDDGQPYRLGFAIGNEFSDHITERQNYLYLAHSKLRSCGVGPALLAGELPEHVAGMSRIRDANGEVRWEKAFVSGEQNMSHTIANLEYHHFKYGLFKRPGDVHIHFFGTATLSFADGVQVKAGETFEVQAEAFGPALSNRLAITETRYVKVNAL